MTAKVLALRFSLVPKNTALVASTYQSQYSLQKNRYKVPAASLNLYSLSEVVISLIAWCSFRRIHLSSLVVSDESISPCTSPPCICRKRQAFHNLLQRFRASSNWGKR